jgi:hypothetical protein
MDINGGLKMIYNLVSIKKVIAKVATDLNWNEETHRISDCIEWAGEALKKVGAYPQFVTKVTGKDEVPLLVIEDYQAKLPTDLYSINQVAYSSSITAPYYPMRAAMGSYSSNHGTTLQYGTVNDVPSNTTSSENITTFSGDRQYSIVGGYIKTNIKEGYLLLSYQAIPVDDDNYPMVPDDESFFEALYWYINMKLMYPKWVAGQIRDAVYYDAKSSWNYYRKQAYGNAMMPNSDELETIKNVWIRLIPEINASKSFYSNIGDQEFVYNKNTR